MGRAFSSDAIFLDIPTEVLNFSRTSRTAGLSYCKASIELNLKFQWVCKSDFCQCSFVYEVREIGFSCIALTLHDGFAF